MWLRQEVPLKTMNVFKEAVQTQLVMKNRSFMVNWITGMSATKWFVQCSISSRSNPEALLASPAGHTSFKKNLDILKVPPLNMDNYHCLFSHWWRFSPTDLRAWRSFGEPIAEHAVPRTGLSPHTGKHEGCRDLKPSSDCEEKWMHGVKKRVCFCQSPVKTFVLLNETHHNQPTTPAQRGFGSTTTTTDTQLQTCSPHCSQA